jgi:quercetin dioxygenase-like cupin family protein
MEAATLKHNFSYCGLAFKIYEANKGAGLEKHEHLYNHATICYQGSCSVRTSTKKIIINLDSGAFDLPANEWHEIIALEDNTVFANMFDNKNT